MDLMDVEQEPTDKELLDLMNEFSIEVEKSTKISNKFVVDSINSEIKNSCKFVISMRLRFSGMAQGMPFTSGIR
jgi:hypothetical protein